MASLKLCVAAVLVAAPVAALAQDDLMKQIVNDPAAPEVDGAKAALIEDAKAEGGKALRVQVPKKGANPWDSTVGGPIKKPINRGDHLVILYSARLEKSDSGATTTTLPYTALQLTAAPYSTILQGSADIGPEWKQFQVTGISNANCKPGELKVTMQLATAKQVVDLGPIIVLDKGQ